MNLNKQDLTKTVEELSKELEVIDFKLTMKPHMPAQITARREQVVNAIATLEAE